MLRLLKICLGMVLLVTAIACSPPSISDPAASSTATPVQAASPSPAIVPEDVVDRLKAALATRTNVPVNAMTLRGSEAMDWSDACLGLPQPDELCAQMITPGYRVIVTTPDGDYVLHSDRRGQSVRIASSP